MGKGDRPDAPPGATRGQGWDAETTDDPDVRVANPPREPFRRFRRRRALQQAAPAEREPVQGGAEADEEALPRRASGIAFLIAVTISVAIWGAVVYALSEWI